MGSWFSFSSKTKVNVCVVGLDNSGKSTILNKMKPAESSINEVTPTVGFTTEEFEHGNISFTAWDMSGLCVIGTLKRFKAEALVVGQSKYRELWQCYFSDAAGIIFVLDSTDGVRMCVAHDELEHLLRHPDTAGKPILFFSNKKDRPDSADVQDVWDKMKLDKISDRPIQIQPSDALRGDGLREGMDWLAKHVPQ